MKAHRLILILKVVAFFVIAISLLSVLAQSRNNFDDPQNEPSLSETVEWLKGKTDEIVGVYPVWVSSGETVENVGQRSLTGDRKLIAEVSNSCSFAWRVMEMQKEAPVTPPPVEQNSKTKKDNKSNIDLPRIIVIRPKVFEATSMSFSASDLNPENIVVIKALRRGEMIPMLSDAKFDWWVKMYTTDKKRSVRWQSASDKEESNGFVVALRTEEMAQRFAKALKHAVKLCGGKLDKKEPF